jgi:lysophospholipase L1-like esterase
MRALAAGVVLALLLVETGLQIAAYVAWGGGEHLQRPEGKVLLCVGDSLTFGLCASDPERAYPPQLAAELVQRGLPWAVRHGALPGQSSADVLRRLPRQLRELRPDAVCVLVGWNDTWARPAPLDDAALPDDGFPWRWRTLRLLQMLTAEPDDSLAATARAPFLGAWHVGEHDFWFAADGTALLGAQPARWTLRGETIELAPVDGSPFTLRWHLVADALEFAVPGWDRFARARRGRHGDGSDEDRIADLLDRGDVDAAVKALEAELAGPRAIATRAQLLGVLLDARRTEAARPHVAVLQEAFERTADADAGQAMARWRLHAGEREAAAAIARAVVQQHPERVVCWRIVVDTCPPAERAGLAAELAHASAACASPWHRAELACERAVVLAGADARTGIDELVAARTQGVGPDETIRAVVRAVALGADRRELLAAVARVDVAAGERQALERDVRRATVDDAAMEAVLARHLGAIVLRCRAAGARVFLLGYPFAMPKHEELVARTAAALGVPFVTLAKQFAAHAAAEPGTVLFADEIHCNDRGYALMARCIAEQLAPALR